MYTRSSRRYYDRQTTENRYTPPPGYVGTAFSENTGVKHHLPDQDVQEFSRRPQQDEHENDIRSFEMPNEHEDSLIEEETAQDRHEDKPHEQSPLEGLIESLHGKIGREELIILMTMFLISSDGICVEALILALVLLAGHEPQK